MEQYFGTMTIGAVENKNASDGIPALEKVDFVHYPDCQQLLIWLPQNGYNYGPMRLINTSTGQVVDQRPTSDRLSGSIKLLWDTLDVAPGDYRVEIEHPEGWMHTISLTKYPENAAPANAAASPEISPEPASAGAPTEYRDGLGDIIPIEDMLLRDKLLKDLENKFSRRIEFTGHFRNGSVVYIDNETRIEFWHEMGGGNCVLFIDIPSEDQWESSTQTPLSSREDILNFVAESVRSQQLSNCTYQITDTAIQYYK